jgi:hypothetical protein
MKLVSIELCVNCMLAYEAQPRCISHCMYCGNELMKVSKAKVLHD